MREDRSRAGQYARRQVVRDLFKDVAEINPRDGEVLVIELQQIVRDAARNEKLKELMR